MTMHSARWPASSKKLKGEGQLLTSARSVYYEEEFLARADRVSGTEEQAWKHWPVRVLDWEEGDRQQYLDEWTRREGISESDSMNLRSRVHVVIGRGNQPLASKPLFFTRMVALLQRNPGFSGGEDLLRELVEDYLNRERKEKLLDRQAEPLLTEEQFERLMRELAEEMWNPGDSRTRLSFRPGGRRVCDGNRGAAGDHEADHCREDPDARVPRTE